VCRSGLVGGFVVSRVGASSKMSFSSSFLLLSLDDECLFLVLPCLASPRLTYRVQCRITSVLQILLLKLRSNGMPGVKALGKSDSQHEVVVWPELPITLLCPGRW
jgi:hypothetical protein